jgi:hypothetical protein
VVHTQRVAASAAARAVPGSAVDGNAHRLTGHDLPIRK